MKRMPVSELDVDCNELYRSLYAPIRSKLLLAAIELKIFDGLSKPSSAEAVAQAISSHLENTRLILDALVASDFLEKKIVCIGTPPLPKLFWWKAVKPTWEPFLPAHRR